MNIDTKKLKQSLEKQKFTEPKGFMNSVIERNYNRGINTAIKIIEFYEEDEINEKVNEGQSSREI